LLIFVSSRRRHTRYSRDWSSDVCSSDLADLISIDAKNAIDNVTSQDFAQRAYEALLKRNGEGLVPSVDFVQGLAIVRSRVENEEIGRASCRERVEVAALVV